MLAMKKTITSYDADSRCEINWFFAFDEEVWEIKQSRQNKNMEGRNDIQYQRIFVHLFLFARHLYCKGRSALAFSWFSFHWKLLNR